MAIIDEQIRAALVAVIGAAAVARDELETRLRDGGHQFSSERVSRQLQFDTSFADLQSGLVHIPSLADGVAFALPVDADDASAGFVRMHPWLDAIGWWFISAQPALVDAAGASLGLIETDGRLIDDVDTDIVLGPEGWLDGLAGGWMALRVRGETVALEPLSGQPAVEAARAEAVAEAFERTAERERYVTVGSGDQVEIARADTGLLLLEAMLARPEAFRGTAVAAPADLLAAAGLRPDGHSAVPAELDADVLADANRQRQARFRYGLDAGTARDLQPLLGAMAVDALAGPDATGPTAEEQAMAPLLAGLLDRAELAPAVAYECGRGEDYEAALSFANAIADSVAGDTWGATWLAAHCLLALGQFDEGAELLDRIPASVESLPLLVDRAAVAVERSEARLAHRLVQRAERLIESLGELSLVRYHFGEIVDELHEEVEEWAAQQPPAMARRNEPCPCGSGRKYKACHLGRELHPLDERAAWLYQKMARFAGTFAADEIETLAWLMADSMERPDQAVPLGATPFLPDLVLHEERLAEEYLDGRQATLPDDEVLLAQQWQLVERSVFEVEGGRAGELHLRDLATGDRVKVIRVAGSAPVRGSIMLGRPLPVGESHRAFSGFMSVRPDLVGEALALLEEGDPDDLVTFLGSMHRPPAITNTDGEDMALTDITWSLPDGCRLDEALTGAGLTCDDGGTWTLVRDTVNQKRSVIASLRVTGSRLEGHVNSAERASELLQLVADVAPGAVHLDTEVQDLDFLDLSAGPAGPPPTPSLPDDPAMRAALEEHIMRYEQEWLDTSIPALSGRTPREAAADPIAREDLVRLLATLPSELDGDTFGMSADRLRAALSL